MQNYALYQIIIYAFYHIRLSYLFIIYYLFYYFAPNGPSREHGGGGAMVACPVVLSYMLDWNM